ncbi:hypothetical protein [Accumulibacter sp.]|uniref:hypothetical protein n=1 Tax=Accumulibacter sp. TaxID=2053492 RepID=UPI0035B2EA67
MKKVAALVAGGLLLCGGVGVAAADSRGSRCEEFSGKLTLEQGPCDEFKAVMRKERIFEDATFLPAGTPAICFSGTIADAQLGGRQVEASSLSALTANSLCLLDPDKCPPPPAFPLFITAATVVTVAADREPRKDKELGQIFLRDTGVSGAGDHRGPFSVEQLIGVGGTKKFTNASVSMEIVGFEFDGGQGNVVPGDPLNAYNPAQIKGTICR